ncbi:hypothetical protein I6N96_10090 [Enterococcus sp. BWM-S5]|uniref:tRNA(His) guanylyltransferase n=1 Tax=Enterococcus larvae TaxID=2794352 RepID=A0ABS4CJ33_9ENTE|nr:tRNA(His) guanylyltransferase Thg1 family protein [Enterococcus larvae]MBP1046638.1 hypothetical protein [Enterococcus larvae]
MKFSELDAKMRIYETNQDHIVLPEMYMVARIDGRNFTTLTKDREKFEAPFDVRFRDYMVETVKHLMNCGFHVIYGYTESDEISLLFSLNEAAFSRKTRKYNSILAGEASAKFSLLLGSIGAFDCRISELPTKNAVIDYFRWRNEDANRNALNAHCYWLQRKQGASVAKATGYLEGLSVSEKNEFLFQHGVNFNEIPKWQKRGIGVYWKQEEKVGFNPVTKESSKTIRRKLFVDYELPMKDAYSEFIGEFLE